MKKANSSDISLKFIILSVLVFLSTTSAYSQAKRYKIYFFKKTDLYVKNGFMEHNGTSFSFTPKGFLVSNTILADLI